MTTTAAAELPTTRIKIRVTYRTRTKASGEVTDVRWRHDGRAWSRSFTDPAMAAR